MDTQAQHQGPGEVIGKPAPDFTLKDQNGAPVTLSEIKKPTMLAFYPGDFTRVCTKELCSYRDHFEEFAKYNLQILGISANTVDSHARFAQKHQFPFSLLSDETKRVSKLYGCTSLLLFGQIKRAIFILSSNRIVLYRYIEPVALTMRKPEELLGVLEDLRNHKLI